MTGRAVKFPTGPSNSRLYGGNVKSNALGGLIAVGFDSYIIVNVQGQTIETNIFSSTIVKKGNKTVQNIKLCTFCISTRN
jgi:hypothetical protein